MSDNLASRFSLLGIEFEGKWEEISQRSSEFAGKRVRVTLLPDASELTEKTRPGENTAMLKIIEKIDVIQSGMNPRIGKSTLEYLREARSGDMYGYSSDDN